MASLPHLVLPHSSGHYRLHISCNQFVQPAIHLWSPLSKRHKKNVFSFLSSTCYIQEFKLHRRDNQCTNCGLRKGEQHGVDFVSLTSLNYNAEKRQPSEMERHSSNSLLSKYLDASKDDLWVRSMGQICANMAGRRIFLSLSSLCLSSLLTVCANAASAK